MILKMENIEHKFIEINGLKHHVAVTGTESSSSTVLFLHGFPEVWYSWRHQLIAVAQAGFRGLAPDYRGYGLSEPPLEPEKATFADLVADTIGLLNALSISSVFVVAKDFGSRIAYLLALLHPEKVSGIVTLGIPYLPPIPANFHESLPEGFYTARWQKPGRAEADFGRFDNKIVFRNIYILFSRSEIPIANENQEIMDMVDPSTPLPPWLSEEDLAAYGSLYQKSGFQTALKVPYRSLNEEFNITDFKLEEVPMLFIMGEKDYFLKFPGIEGYTRSEQGKKFVPKLETVYLPEGTHFVQEQLPNQVNQLLLDFLNNYKLNRL